MKTAIIIFLFLIKMYKKLFQCLKLLTLTKNMEFLGGHCHILMTVLLQMEFEIVSKVRLACKYFKPRKYNEIRVIYLLSERAVSCPLPRSIFMIKVFVQARVHVPVRSAMFVIAFSNLSILIRNLSMLHVKPLMEEMLSSSG